MSTEIKVTPVNPSPAAAIPSVVGIASPKAAPAPAPAAEAAPAASAAGEAAPAPAEAPKPTLSVEELLEREQRMAAGMARLAKDRAALAAQEKALKESAKDLETWKNLPARVQQDPLALVEVFGEERVAALIERLQNVGAQPTEEDRVAALEKKLQTQEAEKKAEAERQAAAQRDAQVRQAQALFASVAQAPEHSERFELVNLIPGALDLAWEVVERHWKSTFNPETGSGQVLPFEVALDATEQTLAEEWQPRLAKSKKLNVAKAQPAPSPAPASTAITSPTAAGAVPTITTRGATGGPAVAASTPARLSREESLKRAAQMLQSRWGAAG